MARFILTDQQNYAFDVDVDDKGAAMARYTFFFPVFFFIVRLNRLEMLFIGRKMRFYCYDLVFICNIRCGRIESVVALYVYIVGCAAIKQLEVIHIFVI